MHEMSVVSRVVNIAERSAQQSGARKVTKLVLQIGQMSAVIPDAVRMCWPICIEETMLAGGVLEIEMVPAIGICRQCEMEYNLLDHEFKCPQCKSEKWEILKGKELFVKEIEVQ